MAGAAVSSSYWLVFYCLKSANVVDSGYLFHVDPQLYLSRLWLLSVRQSSSYRNSFSGVYVNGFFLDEVIRVKSKARQVMYFQATIDAKVRSQYRNAAAYRRRIF